MSRGKRRYLLALVNHGGLGLWSADFRWAKWRACEFVRRYGRGGMAWWTRVNFKVPMRQKRGQKR